MSDPQARILRSIGTVTLVTLAVKTIGFLQQAFVAARFGTGPRIEAYFLSLAVPGILATLVPVTLTAGILPVYLSLLKNQGEARARRFLGAGIGRYLAGLTVLSAAVALGAGPIVAFLAGRQAERALIVHLTWAASPLIMLAGLYSALASIENARGRWIFTTSLQCLPALAIIVFLAAAPWLEVWAIAAGMLLGMTLQLALILSSARATLPSTGSLLQFGDPAFADVRSRIVPLFASSAIVQLNPLVDQIMASTLPPGSLSALAYADRIMTVLQALFISSVSTVGLVSFSKQLAEKDHGEVVATLHSLVRMLAFVLLPLSAGTVVVARPLVAVLFERGAFGAASTTAVSQALVFFALGLFPIGAGFLIPQAYIALGATRTLAVVSVGENLLNVLLNLALMRRFAHSGIAFSTSLVYTAAVLVLAALLPPRLPGLTWRPLAAPLLKIAGATAVMTAVTLLVRSVTAGRPAAVELAAVVGAGIASYLVASRLFRVEDLRRLTASFFPAPRGAGSP